MDRNLRKPFLWRRRIESSQVNLSKSFGSTTAPRNYPLTEAVLSDNLEIMEYLVKKGINVNNLDHMQCTPLFIAIEENASLDVVKMLLENAANVNDVNSNGDTVLTMAIRARNIPLLKLLVSNGADVNKIGASGKTPLSLAVTTNNSEAVKVLMEYGADPEKLNITGAVGHARSVNMIKEIVAYLKAEGKTVDVFHERIFIAATNKVEYLEGSTPLGRAVLLGDFEETKRLINSGADTCEVGANGKSPLFLAVLCRNLAFVVLLLEYGAELTIHTAFMESISLNYTEIANHFLERGVSVNLIYKNGCTPLTKAVEKHNFEIVRALITKSANVNMSDRYGNSPLLISLKNQNKKIGNFLILKGAKVDEAILEENNFEAFKLLRQMEEYCILIKAVHRENLLVIKFLVEQDVHIYQRDSEIRTALAVAALNKNFGVVKNLIDLGASVKLAQKELEEFAAENEDFDIYFQYINMMPSRKM